MIFLILRAGEKDVTSDCGVQECSSKLFSTLL